MFASNNLLPYLIHVDLVMIFDALRGVLQLLYNGYLISKVRARKNFFLLI
jgi:hypothetical protein